MPVDKVKVKIDKRAITLSNTQKVLYPQSAIIKAEVIQYMISMSDHILPLISGRPLTTIRWPDGIDGKMFYSKNKPSWTPKWLKSFKVKGQKDNDYLIITDKASLAWVANLAALELHPMNMRISHPGHPDQMIFDLDPSEDFAFDDLKQMSIDLKVFLESEGYQPFVKTSGGKGLHIYLPIIPQYSYEEVVNQSKKLAKRFITEHPNTTTLRIGKEKRKGKVLIDIYRNHQHNSCIAPFSLRGKPGAPVSTPFPWKWMDKVNSSQQWNLKNVRQFIEEAGNSWADFDNYSTTLNGEPKNSIESEYVKKRDFKKTSEPQPEEIIHTTGDQYVIQLHNASNLHYDLRLEHQGTLWSWAIPKGIPHKKGIKRLAIRTEDHPLKYLTFEGVIPKGQYGGGEMWVFDSGRYSEIEWSEKKIKFQLKGGEIKGKFYLYNTKDDQWLIERKDEVDPPPGKFTPMLASSSAYIPDSDKYFHEIKWDGIRATFIIDDGTMKILSRSGNDITDKFPEITAQVERIEAEQAVMDGEIVYLDEKGKPDFGKVVGRIHLKSPTSITKSSISRPATAYLFDLLSLDGRKIRKEPCTIRRSWLRTILSPNERLRFSEAFQDGSALFKAITDQGMEGIISKLKSAPYRSGQRSEAWLKIKVRNVDRAYIIGWTKGKGDRAGLVGAFHLAKQENDH
ncbi:MAG: hypothetical protein HKN68_05985, partial [Saprospiraceae bacterium]|nr:hypothetical protein [Saprospiraceae bacterium]